LVDKHEDLINFNNSGVMQVGPLHAGEYLISNKSNPSNSIKLTVVKGRRIPEYGMILTENNKTLYENPLKITNVSGIAEAIHKEDTLEVDVFNSNDNTKVHVIASPYYSNQMGWNDLMDTIQNGALGEGFRQVMADS